MANIYGDNDWLSALKQKIDIVDIVSRYIPVEQKGRNFWACCPFHHEKTPSFAINQDRQTYHCFGCGKNGDAIKFVQEYENIDFMQAVRLISDRVGFVLPERTGSESISARKEKKQRLLNLLKETARHYNFNLKLKDAKPATEYMKKRKISEDVATKFGLGYSLGFGEVVSHLKEKGFSEKEMIDAGVVSEKNGKVFDTQYRRLIFPIIDGFSNVIAFGGRNLEDGDFAKYKNTMQTALFDKSQTLYNINNVKKIKQQKGLDSVIIVEGYMDTVSLSKAGFENVVASMGTSLTENQAEEIKRLCSRVYICYDGDGAGQKATLRGLDILLSKGLSVRVVELPEGLDPDDVINRMGKQEYQNLLDRALLLIDYKLKCIEKQYDISDVEQKRAFISSCLDVIKELKTHVEQEDYIKWLKEKTSVTYDALRQDLKTHEANQKVSKIELGSNKIQELNTADTKALRFLLASCLLKQNNVEISKNLSGFMQSDIHRTIYDYVLECIAKRQVTSANVVLDALDINGKKEFDAMMQEFHDVPEDAREDYFFDCASLFKEKELDLQNQILKAEISETQDGEERKKLLLKMQENIKELKKIRYKGVAFSNGK